MMTSRRASACLIAVLPALAAAAPAGAGVKSHLSPTKSLLIVEGDAAKNRIVVRCDSLDRVKVNGRTPRGGPVGCARVDEVDVLGRGGDDYIDVSRIDARFGEASFKGFGVGTGAALLAGSGDDRVVGSAVAFNLVLGYEGSDEATGGRRRDLFNGGLDDDELSARGGRDRLLGSGGGDRLRGGDGRDLLSGNAGADRLFGQAGNDLLGGGAGRDKLRGGPGDDALHGGLGKDLLGGGPGRDKLEQE